MKDSKMKVNGKKFSGQNHIRIVDLFCGAGGLPHILRDPLRQGSAETGFVDQPGVQAFFQFFG